MARCTIVLLLLACCATVVRSHGAGPALSAPAVSLDTHGVSQAFVRIAGGSFEMGSAVRPEEGPIHAVTVPSFDLATTEVTIRQFRAFVQATGYVTDAERAGHSVLCCWRPKLGVTWKNAGFLQSDDEPVLAVSWNDAKEFCKWLSAETGLDYRLPTEAEWEFAARRDQEGQALRRSAWYDGNAGGRSHPVGRRAAGRLRLHDLLGNAWEWVEDVYHDSYRGAPSTGAAWDENGSVAQRGWVKAGEGRVLRGGSWGSCDCRHPVGYEVTATSRPVFGASASCNNSGFRLARTVPPARAPDRSRDPGARKLTPRGMDLDWIELPAGSFQLGAADRKGPSRRVRFPRTVRMMRDEVTVAQFRAFARSTGYVTDAERKGWAWDSDFRSRHAIERKAGASWSNPGYEPSTSDPVSCVSWNDAHAFCRWLSAESGRNYRLPTEAEWEYACTAGGTEKGATVLADVAWYFENSGFRTHPVGTRKPNAWGFRDMLGNVAEWVLDTWSPDLGRIPSDGSAVLGLPTAARVVRGGSYEREPNEFGPRARDWHDQAEAIAGVGFRIVDATR